MASLLARAKNGLRDVAEKTQQALGGGGSSVNVSEEKVNEPLGETTASELPVWSAKLRGFFGQTDSRGGEASAGSGHAKAAESTVSSGHGNAPDSPRVRRRQLKRITELVNTLGTGDCGAGEKQQMFNELRSLLVLPSGAPDHEARKTAVVAGVIPSLLEMVYNPHTSTEACWVIQLLSASKDASDYCREALLAEHVLVILCDIVIDETCRESARGHAISALFNLAINSEMVHTAYAENRKLLDTCCDIVRKCQAIAIPAIRLALQLGGPGGELSNTRREMLAEHGWVDACCCALVHPSSTDELQLCSVALLHKLVIGHSETANTWNIDSSMQENLALVLKNLKGQYDQRASVLTRGLVSTFTRIASLAYPTTPTVDSNERVSPREQLIRDIDDLLHTVCGESMLSAEVSTGANSVSDTDVENCEECSSGSPIHTTTAVGATAAAAADAVLSGLVFAKRKLSLRVSGDVSESDAASVQEVAFADDLPIVLDPSDPDEIIMRRVTEQSIRKEFVSSGGVCTPQQIANRFKRSLTDPMYGAENRIRFQEVIDQIADAVVIEENGVPTSYLILKEAPEKANELPSSCSSVQTAPALMDATNTNMT